MLTNSLCTRRPLAASLVALSCLALSNSASAQVEHLETRIRTDRSAFLAGEPIEVEVSFTNTSAGRIAFLPWNTPLEENFFADMFDITFNGEAMPYEGRMAMRIAPTQADYIVLEAYETVWATLDIASAYKMRWDGRYTICLQAFVLPPEHPLIGIENAGWGELTSNRIALDVIGNVLDRPTGGDQQNAVGPVQDDIIDSIVNATQMAKDKAREAKNCIKASNEFKKWFGSVSADCLAQVKENWCKILDGLCQPIEYCIDNGCPPNVIAYVYPCDTNKIYLCPLFFSLPPGYTQWGVIIHEMSHFKNGAGTDDCAYGPQASCQLAMMNPAKAKNNADTYRLFIERKKTVQPEPPVIDDTDVELDVEWN